MPEPPIKTEAQSSGAMAEPAKSLRPMLEKARIMNEEEIRIVRWDGASDSVLASIRARHAPISTHCDNLRPRPAGAGLPGDLLAFDPANGRLLVPVESYCSAFVEGGDACPVDYGGGWWIVAFEGLATVSEIDESSSGPFDPAPPDEVSTGLRTRPRNLVPRDSKR